MSADSVVRREVTVHLLGGLHLRPASLIARLVASSTLNVRIIHGDKSADASDVFDLIALEAGPKAILTLESQGLGAADLLAEIVPFFENEDAGPTETQPE